MELVKLSPRTLYIVATPIGNFKDITIRALETLKQVDVILAEDTRVTQSLLAQYGITHKKLISYHAHNEKQRQNSVLSYFEQDLKVALVSDAGTPLISDPGNVLVKTLLKEQIQIVSVPGVTAFTTLLPITGFSLQDFIFKGFLSSKQKKRRDQLQELRSVQSVFIFYEAPHRIKEFVEDLYDLFAKDTQIVIGRELTKQYESIYRGSLEEIYTKISTTDFVYKGEFCIIINNK